MASRSATSRREPASRREGSSLGGDAPHAPLASVGGEAGRPSKGPSPHASALPRSSRSDGLTDPLNDAQIATILGHDGTEIGDASKALIEAANAGGGPDNITVILAAIR